jgi:hypothetical protein
MKNVLITVIVCLAAVMTASAQTMEEMQAMKVAKAAELAALQPKLDSIKGRVDALTTEVADLTEKITPYPRLEMGASGNLGFNFSSFSDWLSKSQPNTTAFNISFAGNGHLDYLQQKYFWRNNLNLTMGWQKYDDRDDPTDNKDFKVTADAASLTSLFGYKLSEKLALSTMAEYRTSLFDGNFNEPGYLDLGAGITWTPNKDLFVVVHPLDYNFIFSTSAFDYQSTYGCKILADYKKQISKNLAWKSNLSAFASYKGIDFSNWTWINGLTTSVKGFGLGFDFGLRGSRQEAAEHGLSGNPLQSYWIVGVSYAL